MPATVLVADDNSNIQRMVTLELEGEGFRVVAVGNGEAAVRKISELRPDLVLADVFMPVRTGYEVCEFVKKNEALAKIPVVLLIGAFDPLDEGEVQRVRADGVLKKPFVPPDPLILTVKQLLERAGVSTAKPDSGKAGVPVPSPTAAAPAFEFVGNDHMPAPFQAFVPPTPPVPRPYPPEPPSPAAPVSDSRSSGTAEASTRVVEKVEEEEEPPQDWIPRPEPVTFLGREEDKPLVFSELLEETAPAKPDAGSPESGKPTRPLTPEEEVRELLREKTSAFYDFDDVEAEDKPTAAGEPRSESALGALPTPREEAIPTETLSEPDSGEPPELARHPESRSFGTELVTAEGGFAEPVLPAGEEDGSRPVETPSASSSVADQAPPAEAMWATSADESAALPPLGQEEQTVEESEPIRGETAQGEPEHVPQSGMAVESTPPFTKLQGWLRETFGMRTEAPLEPPHGEPFAEDTQGGPIVQPLEVSESALETVSEPPPPSEEATLETQAPASQLDEAEEKLLAPLGEVSYESISHTLEAEQAGEPVEEIPMEQGSAVQHTFRPEPDLASKPASAREEAPPAPPEAGPAFEENLVEPAPQDAKPAAEATEAPLVSAEELRATEPFWSVEEPPLVEETTESIRTERFATESFVTEAPTLVTPPPGPAIGGTGEPRLRRGEEPSVIEEPFLAVPVGDEPAPRLAGPAEPVQGKPAFALTPPPGPAPENGELVQKVVEEVMARLSPELLEQISRELVKPLAEAVLKRNRPKPE